jgi:GT2 family glycosyltransferase
MGVGQDSKPRVSVVIPVRDNPGGVRSVLERLAVQTLGRDAFEVVIGNDGSDPGPLDLFGTADRWIRIVHGAKRTSYAARNRATAAARGEVIAFCDSDCLPEPTWLEEGLAALGQADVAAGEVTFLSPDRPTIWSLLTADMFLDQERNVALGRGVTANLFVSRRLFDELGGFDESLPSGGDYDFVRRADAAGARVVYCPRAVVFHPTLDSRPEFLRKIRSTNRWAAVRRARDGARLDPLALTNLVPVMGVVIARRRALRPVWRLQESRLHAAHLVPTAFRTVLALLALHSLVAPVAVAARVRGWAEGSRLRRRKVSAPAAISSRARGAA